MAEHMVYHVTVSQAREYEFVATFPDLAGAQPLLLDEPAPLGDSRGPNAVALLAAAVGNCLAASLLHCLRRSRADAGKITAQVSAHVERTSTGRLRISQIDVALSPEIGAADAARLVRCEDLFEDFCTVTASVRQGIPVNVTVNDQVPLTA